MLLLNVALAASVALGAELTCRDVGAPFGGVQSQGPVQVPRVLDPESGFKDLDGVKTLNRKFKLAEIERIIFDPKQDLASKARLLTEFKCFGSWRAQHDFYLRVLQKHQCALLRNLAVELLENDLCSESTFMALMSEYKNSIYPQIQTAILKIIGLSSDKRASVLLDEALRGKSKVLSKAAQVGKSAAAGKVCTKQAPAEEPLYGPFPQIAAICRGEPEEQLLEE
jgi:hypothetical protein